MQLDCRTISKSLHSLVSVYIEFVALASFEMKLFVFMPGGQTCRHREQNMDSEKAVRALGSSLGVILQGQAAIYKHFRIQTAKKYMVTVVYP